MKNGFNRYAVALVALVAQSSNTKGFKAYYCCTFIALVALSLIVSATCANEVQRKNALKATLIKESAVNATYATYKSEIEKK